MLLTLEQADNAHRVLSKFTEQNLPIKLSYKLMKVISGLEQESNFFRKEMENLIDTYAEKDENNQLIYTDNGEGIKLKEESQSEFSKKYKELIEMSVEVPSIYFNLDELSNLELTPKDLYLINFFIEE